MVWNGFKNSLKQTQNMCAVIANGWHRSERDFPQLGGQRKIAQYQQSLCLRAGRASSLLAKIAGCFFFFSYCLWKGSRIRLLPGNQSFLPLNVQIMQFLNWEMGRLAHTPPVKWWLTAVCSRLPSIHVSPSKTRGRDVSWVSPWHLNRFSNRWRKKLKEGAQDTAQQDIQASFQGKSLFRAQTTLRWPEEAAFSCHVW